MQEHTNDTTPLPPEGDLTDRSLPLTDLEQIGQRPPSWRKRLIHIGIILVVGGGIVLVTVGSLFKQATPLPPLAKSPPMMVIASNINYGTLTLDGKPQQGKLPELAPMPSGAFTLTIDAPPFLPQSCHITSQHTSLDRCQPLAIGSQTMTLNGITARVSFGVEIAFTASDLPATQRTQVQGLLTQRLSTKQAISVPMGSYFATDFGLPRNITSQRAAALLQATANLTTNAYFIGSSPDQQGYACDGFTCTQGLTPTQIAGLASLGGQNWLTSTPLAVRWRFTTAGGEPISAVVFPAVVMTPVDLVYTQKSGWQIAQPNSLTGPPLDPTVVLPHVACLTGLLLLNDQISSTRQMTVADHGVEGCLYALQANTQDLGQFLWRFGVLLAADAKAHATLPALPVAPPEEITAVEG